MPNDFNAEYVKRPEVILGELLRRYARGEIAHSYDSPKVVHRVVVLAVDEEGGRLSGPTQGASVHGVGVDGQAREYPRLVGPTNPRNSVKALVIDAAHDVFFDEDSARILWPFFPADQFCLPVAPGEHAYAMFEDASFEHGLWLCRVSGHDGANFVSGAEHYSAAPGERKLSGLFGDAPSSPSEKRPTDSYSTRVSPSKRRLNDMF